MVWPGKNENRNLDQIVNRERENDSSSNPVGFNIVEFSGSGSVILKAIQTSKIFRSR